ncbi:MAG: hypothetical protein ACREUW_18460 [Burkholderiales bacterium]
MLRTSAVALLIAALGGITAYWSASHEVVEYALLVMCLSLVLAVMFVLLSLSEEGFLRERHRKIKSPARATKSSRERRGGSRTVSAVRGVRR